MNAVKSGHTRRASAPRATPVPTASSARRLAGNSQFRVEVLKQAIGAFSLYQIYTDKGLADRVADQLKWVGATVRVVCA